MPVACTYILFFWFIYLMEIWTKTCDLFFKLSNEDRVKILYQINIEPSTITVLAKKLGLSTQEVSRHVSRLMDQRIVTRNIHGEIILDNYGRAILFCLPYFQFITQYKDYFNSHTLHGVPSNFIVRLHEIQDSILVEDPMTVFQRIQLMSENADEYIYRLTDQHLTMIYPQIQSAADRGVEFKLLESLHYRPNPAATVYPRVAPSETRGLENIPMFLALSEKEVAAIAFPLTSGGFDYYGFSSDDPKTHEWCLDLFSYYWERAKPKA